MIRTLIEKGLVKITGRDEVLGRPLLYGTTTKFLDHFGLKSIKELPKVEDLEMP
jgi:segregation and condensation protein B